jgi:hypothetical protein
VPVKFPQKGNIKIEAAALGLADELAGAERLTAE